MERRVAFVLSLIVVLVTGIVGVYNGLADWGEGRTPMQHSVPVGVLLYGSFGLVTFYGLFRRRPWRVATSIAWAIPITYVPGVAIMVYGGPGAILGSAIAASAGSALIALGVAWTARATTPDEQRTASQT